MMLNPMFLKALAVDIIIIAMTMMAVDSLMGTSLFITLFVVFAVIYAIIHSVLEWAGVG